MFKTTKLVFSHGEVRQKMLAAAGIACMIVVPFVGWANAKNPGIVDRYDGAFYKYVGLVTVGSVLMFVAGAALVLAAYNEVRKKGS